MPRGIDHLVIAVRDLDAARAKYQRLGFALTPEARHPFGTKNSLVQLDGAFLELVAIADPALIPEPTDERFSFAAFNRGFLGRREGLSMLVLRSRDANIDHADFATRGLPVYEPLRFERTARGPDETERTVAFTMNFTADERIKDAGFFTCQHHFPENFWRSEFQTHPNGARLIASAMMVVSDPAEFAGFLSGFAGVSEVKSVRDGIEIDTGEGRIEVLTPEGVRASLGSAVAIDGTPEPRFVAFGIEVADLADTSDFLRSKAVPFEGQPGRLVIAATEACGGAIVFGESSFPARSV